MCIALLYIHTQAKVLLTMMLSSIKALIKIQLLVNVPGKAANDDSNNQVAATKVGDLTLVQCSPCFCFHSKKKAGRWKDSAVFSPSWSNFQVNKPLK